MLYSIQFFIFLYHKTLLLFWTVSHLEDYCKKVLKSLGTTFRSYRQFYEKNCEGRARKVIQICFDFAGQYFCTQIFRANNSWFRFRVPLIHQIWLIRLSCIYSTEKSLIGCNFFLVKLLRPFLWRNLKFYFWKVYRRFRFFVMNISNWEKSMLNNKKVSGFDSFYSRLRVFLIYFYI